ncbi:MAG TPA: response regulator [Acidimicrobiales bacterium]|nr:response regulator [Acidimicrobiales bacterium]
MRAIIVDDSRAMRTILRKLLVLRGFAEVAEAEHGRAALDRLEVGPPPELVLIDWNMPVMNGIELVCALRSDRRFDRTRLLMVTSESSPRHVYEALKAGVDEYAMKPITREVIDDKLAIMGLDLPEPSLP